MPDENIEPDPNDYDWRTYEDEDWLYRFPREVGLRGTELWSQQFESSERWNNIGASVDRDSFHSSENLWDGQPQQENENRGIVEERLTGWFGPELLFALRGEPPPPVSQQNLRVFISHRNRPLDRCLAEKCAKIATRAKFKYWLDLHDPSLAKLNAKLRAHNSLPPTVKALATATIIEMALLNCTHVLAIWSAGTRGSEWVPYEYGRVKHPKLTSLRTAVLANNRFRIPDYVYLGLRHKTLRDVENWLHNEQANAPPP